MPILRSFCRLFIIVCSILFISPSTVYAAVFHDYQEVTFTHQPIIEPLICGPSGATGCVRFGFISTPPFPSVTFSSFDPTLGDLNSAFIEVGYEPGSPIDDRVTFRNDELDTEAAQVSIASRGSVSGNFFDTTGIKRVDFTSRVNADDDYTVARFGSLDIPLPTPTQPAGIELNPEWTEGGTFTVDLTLNANITLFICQSLAAPELGCPLTYDIPAPLDGKLWAEIAYDYTPVSAVPVPAAGWLFGTALMGLIGFAKRKSSIAA